MVKLESILFWIFIIIIVGTALWLLHGSPQEISAIITIGLSVAGSELLIWKSLFKIDKKTAIGFLKTKHNLDLLENNINNKFDNINNKLNNIERLIKK